MCFAAPISNRETVVDRRKPLDASIAGIDRHDESHVGRVMVGLVQACSGDPRRPTAP
jgi:hypothetical protein